MVLSRMHAYCACLSAAFVIGCSASKPLSADITGGGGGGQPSSGNTAGSHAGTGGGSTCTAPDYASNAAPVQLDEVQMKLVDLGGAPVPDVPVQVCGLDICLNASTESSGVLTLSPRRTFLSPAVKYGDGFGFAKLAVALSSEPKQLLGNLVVLTLPDYSDGAPFPKSGEVTNGDVTLILASGSAVSHDILTYTDASELVFRSVPIPLAQSAPALDPSLSFELGYSLAPVSTTFCPPAGLRLKNSAGWAAGTAVEVFIQGLEVDHAWAPYAGWVRVAEASVGSDGSSIETTSGGIPILSSIAVRRK
jgi:hypothetical protein